MNDRGTLGARLLVSVRSADEAHEALAGGAHLIDVKEPDRGALGRADYSIIQEVVCAVSRRVPVSAALGELADWTEEPVPEGIAFVKWGLANRPKSSIGSLSSLRRQTQGGEPVLVAYADHERANSPPTADLVAVACQLRFRAFLIDTAVKDGSTLLDWVKPSVLTRLRSELAAAGVRVAVAGSLGVREIRTLAPVAPDWFAVRGAVCEGGRTGRMSRALVAQVRDVIAEAGIRSTAG